MVGLLGWKCHRRFKNWGTSNPCRKNNRALIREDDDVAEEVLKALKTMALNFGNSIAREIQVEENGKEFLICDQADKEPIKIEFDEILFAQVERQDQFQ